MGAKTKKSGVSVDEKLSLSLANIFVHILKESIVQDYIDRGIIIPVTPQNGRLFSTFFFSFFFPKTAGFSHFFFFSPLFSQNGRLLNKKKFFTFFSINF